MSTLAAATARLVIVEEEPAMRDLLALVLGEAGYEVHFAWSIGAAHALLATQPFDLLIVDLSARPPDDPFAVVRPLHAQAAPRPVGLITAWADEADEAERQGFAFLVPMPFDLERLLLAVATSIARPLSPAQERHAQVVQQYFAALEARAWDALLALCTDDIRYVLPPPAPFATALDGKAAFRAYTVETFAQFPRTHFTAVQPYATPRGIAARYHGSWQGAAGEEMQQEGATLFAFEGDLIAQIGIHLDAEELRRLVLP